MAPCLLQVPIKRAQEVEEVFDAISYHKGCSVIKMLRAVLGADHFQAGLQIYMNRHQYGERVFTYIYIFFWGGVGAT